VEILLQPRMVDFAILEIGDDVVHNATDAFAWKPDDKSTEQARREVRSLAPVCRRIRVEREMGMVKAKGEIQQFVSPIRELLSLSLVQSGHPCGSKQFLFTFVFFQSTNAKQCRSR